MDDDGYQVIKAFTIIDLVKLVNSNMAKGWKPIGGIFGLILTDIWSEKAGLNREYYQAMIYRG